MQVPRILNPIVAVIESITRFVSVFMPWPIVHNRCAEHPHVKEMIVNAHGSVKVTAWHQHIWAYLQFVNTFATLSTFIRTVNWTSFKTFSSMPLTAQVELTTNTASVQWLSLDDSQRQTFYIFAITGADNFYDAGSCIDGRLTSAWNW